MIDLIPALTAALERERVVSPQVVRHLLDTYGIGREAIGEFLERELSGLEDFEVDLVLSPIFTPTLKDQAVFAELLGQESVSRSEWPAIIRRLVNAPTRAQLVSEDGQVHEIPLREVTVERFVHRLRLDGAISAEDLKLIGAVATAGGAAEMKAIARRAIWEKPGRHAILRAYLEGALAEGEFRLADAEALLKLAETYEPADVEALLSSIPHWLSVLEQEVNESRGAKPFFNERVEDMHGGLRDQRRKNNAREAVLVAEQEFLRRLQRLLARQSGGVVR